MSETIKERTLPHDIEEYAQALLRECSEYQQRKDIFDCTGKSFPSKPNFATYNYLSTLLDVASIGISKNPKENTPLSINLSPTDIRQDTKMPMMFVEPTRSDMKFLKLSDELEDSEYGRLMRNIEKIGLDSLFYTREESTATDETYSQSL
ncbi:hypothetical protein K8R14_04250 [bacterium]|nr:hypothetical protein [bacterium]